jgi:hypothetical protein
MRTRCVYAASTALVVALACVGNGAVQAAQTAANGPAIPRTADGKPDFSGIWQTLSPADFDLEPHQARKDAPPGLGVVDGSYIPYQPKALEQRKKNFAARATLDPRTKCYALGTPRGIYYPEPFQIFQRPQDVTIVFEFGHPFRTIRTSGTRHPKGGIGFWYGDSRGHWEGDTLVVDVTDFNGEAWLDRAGNFTSEDLHVVERWSFIDANTLDYQATLTDSTLYTKPWSIDLQLYRHREKNAQLIENYCYTLDYEDYYPIPKDGAGGIGK